jgi:hypothetical protein
LKRALLLFALIAAALSAAAAPVKLTLVRWPYT